MKIFFLLVTFIITRTACIAQTQEPNSSKVFLSAGYGLAGSFFARSYDEATPSTALGYKAFLDKNFFGTAQELALGVHLKRNIDIKFGYSRQRFTRHVLVDDTLSRGVGLLLDHRIQDADNNWFLAMAKNYIQKKQQFSWGAGLYLLAAQQHTVEVYTNYIIDREFNSKPSRLSDLGAFAELGYEYTFQPKVNIGVKGQFFLVVSGSYVNSVALLPFIKLNF